MGHPLWPHQTINIPIFFLLHILCTKESSVFELLPFLSYFKNKINLLRICLILCTIKYTKFIKTGPNPHNKEACNGENL